MRMRILRTGEAMGSSTCVNAHPFAKGAGMCNPSSWLKQLCRPAGRHSGDASGAGAAVIASASPCNARKALRAGLGAVPFLVAAVGLPIGAETAEFHVAPDIIAFCRAEGNTRPSQGRQCVCSAEQIEHSLAPGEFLRHLTDLRTRGALTSAETAAVSRVVTAACDDAGVVAFEPATRSTSSQRADQPNGTTP